MLHAQWNIANVNGELKGTKNIQISKEEEKNEKICLLDLPALYLQQ